MKLKFCPLFSGSSGNSLYVGGEKAKILIDAGMSGAKIEGELERIGVDPEELDAILITHEHADHIAGVGVLSRRYHLPVYANEATWAAMEGKVKNIAPENIRTFQTGEDFYLGDLNIAPYPTSHDAAESVGYVISCGHCRVAVATDLGVVKEGWLNAAQGADVVLLESNHDVEMLKSGRYPYELKRRILGKHGHLSNDDAGRAALELVRRGVRCIILGHLSKENNFPELAYRSVACVLEQEGISAGELKLRVASREGCNPLYTISDEGDVVEEAISE